MKSTVVTLVLYSALVHAGSWAPSSVLDACPGYVVTDTVVLGANFTATLALAGEPCNVFGEDVQNLTLSVIYETESRVHVKIIDASSERYEVPEEVVPRPSANTTVDPATAAIQFNYTAEPFAFTIYRTSTQEVLFSTESYPIIFEPQYLRIKTILPDNANIYGLGEHTNPFRLPTHNQTMTLWSRDAYAVPVGTNLYGNHPIYFEHRSTGTHGVLLLNSNGMDIKLNDTEDAGVTLEYSVIGGVLDFYFLAGSVDDPIEVARQYAEVVGTPAEVPYWSFGLNQCRFGYTDYVNVAGVISNYSAAAIPLEAMWVDIDYMQGRRVFTVDPEYFPLDRMREIVSYLHNHTQKFILMNDPAVAYTPTEDYGPYTRGTDANIWLKMPNGSAALSLVWPGVTVYPDWFHPSIQDYWDNEFELFYNPESGLDIDGAWIDMNEPSNFCVLPCEDPFAQAIQQALPPPRSTLPPDPNTPIFGNSTLGRRDIMDPPYTINNAAGDLSSKTSWVNSTHANGLIEYDVHNLYGTMMSSATRDALLDRRPGLKPLVITRSTFAGAGKHVGKWLGDNESLWEHYRRSISGLLGFATVYQVPMVGADICGYAGNTTETLCARWALLGAFYPFMRNHNSDTSISQEFYRWETVTEAAKFALDIRYRLMDYLYTAFHTANSDGTPVIQPMWMQYPKDTSTYSLDLQFFFGDSILVTPVTEENSTTVTFYLPDDVFYDFVTLQRVQGQAQNVTSTNISFTETPVHIKGGSILPLRNESAMTTTELRTKAFEILIALDNDGNASGNLYIDDGVSLEPDGFTSVDLSFSNSTLVASGTFGYNAGVDVTRITILGIDGAEEVDTVLVNDTPVDFSFDDGTSAVVLDVDLPLTNGFILSLC